MHVHAFACAQRQLGADPEETDHLICLHSWAVETLQWVLLSLLSLRSWDPVWALVLDFPAMIHWGLQN
jgi:hypothetical protein